MKTRIIVVALLAETVLSGNARLRAAEPSRPTSENKGQAKPTPAVQATQATAVNQALDELKNIYSQAGTLSWEQAKAHIAQREKATQELADRLAALGPHGARALAGGYSQTDSARAKLLIVRGLSKINDAEAVGVLQDVLTRDNALSVRKEVVRAFGHREEEAAEQALAGVLSHPDAQLRFAAAQAFSKRKNAVRILAKQLKREGDPHVRGELIRSVGLIGNQDALNVLAETAQSQMDRTVRKTAIRELSRSFGENGHVTLSKLLSDPDQEIRKSAAAAIARTRKVGPHANP